jgi:hypothetical protein
MKVYKVTSSDGVSAYFDAHDNFSDVLDDIEDLVLDLQVGETVEVTMVELTEKEFEIFGD